MTDLAIETRGIERHFGDFRAVDGVDLRIERGEIYGFLGPNGAGKSTLVRMLCTLLAPTAGSAVVAGHDLVREAEQVRLRIGVALQEASLDKKQTGRELLEMQARLYGFGRAEREARLREVAELVAIGDALDRRIGTYSGGMARRLDLAAALVHNPDVLFLDEPTTGLDPISRATVWAEVQRVNSELGTTIFLTTQYLEEADALADRVGIIAAGRLIAEGSPAELKRSLGNDVITATIEGDVGAAADAVRHLAVVDHVEECAGELLIQVREGAGAVSPVAVALDQCGVTVTGLTLRTPTLDDVFLELTGRHLRVDEERASAEPAAERGGPAGGAAR
jgi:ABC-2 type transport system ATP-binding protein